VAFTEAVKKSVWQYFVSTVTGWAIVWGNENAPAPSSPYCALFFTGESAGFYDSFLQNDSEETESRTGIRAATVEARFIGSGAMDAAGAIYDESRGSNYDFKTAGFAIMSCGAPDERTALHENGRDYINAAALAMRINYAVERTQQQEAIETTTTRGELRYGNDGAGIIIEVNTGG
jgi:hypothetical protein